MDDLTIHVSYLSYYPKEVQKLVGKLLDFKLSIVKGNDVNLPREIKSDMLPWATQLRDEAQELIELLVK